MSTVPAGAEAPLAAHWEWAGSEQNQTERGLHVIILLKHTLRPISVRVHTLIDGAAVLTRWLEITNRGAQPAALGTVSAWSGVLQLTNRWKAHMSESDAPLYSIGYMANPHWGHEGSFQWFDLPNAGYRIDGRFRRDRHRHPMFVLRNNATGEHFIGQLAWSGGYVFEFDLDADIGSTDGAARLFFGAGPDAPSPQRVIAVGETIQTPEMHMSAPHEPEYRLRPRGLDISKRYKVTWDNSGQTCEVDGFTLVQQGVVVRLEGALTSELLLFEAV